MSQVYDVESFRKYLEAQDPGKEANIGDRERCWLCQWMRAVGAEDVWADYTTLRYLEPGMGEVLMVFERDDGGLRNYADWVRQMTEGHGRYHWYATAEEALKHL